MKDVKGNEVGSAWFTADSRSRAVWVEVYLTGHFTPGFHGMHVHEKGNCAVGDPKNPFTAAGGHLISRTFPLIATAFATIRKHRCRTKKPRRPATLAPGSRAA